MKSIFKIFTIASIAMLSFGAFGQTPYVPFMQPNTSDWEFNIHLNEGDTLFGLNDNNPNGADGKTYILVFRQQQGAPTPTGTWTFNQLVAPYDMDVKLSFSPTMGYVLDDLYNAYVECN